MERARFARAVRTVVPALLAVAGVATAPAAAASSPCPALRFAPPRDLAPLPDPGTLRVADLDGDRRRDLLVLDASGYTVRAFLQRQDGTFSTVPPLDVSAAARLLTADLDGDGAEEGVLIDSGGPLALRLGPGGTLVTGPRAAPPLLGASAGPLTTADLDRDGRHELLALVDSGLMAYRLGPEGGLLGQLVAPLAIGTAGGRSLVAGDFDGDGDVDVVASVDLFPQSSPTLPVLWGDGNGGFREGPPVHFPAMRSVAVADFDGDGRTDFVFTAYGGKYGYWSSSLVRYDAGAGLKATQAPFGTSGSSAPQVLAGDLDGDGRADAVGVSFGYAGTYRFDGEVFERMGRISPFMPTVAADVDGDGLADLLSTGSGMVQVVLAVCDPAPADATVPVVVSLAGANGVRFETELTIDSLGPFGIWPIEVTYVPSIGGGGGTVVIPASPAPLFFPSVFDALAALGLPVTAQGDRAGTLSIRAPGWSLQELSVTTRVVAVGAGRGGVGFPEVPLGAGRWPTAVVGWLRESGGDRSNLALVNIGTAAEGDAVLRATLFSAEPSGRSHVLPEVRLAPGKLHQWNRVLSGAAMTSGWAVVERVQGSAPFFAYGVVNDEGTGDGSFVAGFQTDRPPLRSWVVPAIVESGRYTSDLVVTNGTEQERVLDCRLVSDALTRPDRTARFLLVVPARGQLFLDGLVEQLRARGVDGIPARGPEVFGALFVELRGEPSAELFIGARTSAGKPEGRYGVFYEAVRADRASVSAVTIPAVRLDEGARTNVAIVNLDGAAASFRLFAGDKNMQVTVGPRRVLQVGSVLGALGSTAKRGTVLVAVDGRLVPFVAYGVTNEGAWPEAGSDDGTFVWGR